MIYLKRYHLYVYRNLFNVGRILIWKQPQLFILFVIVLCLLSTVNFQMQQNKWIPILQSLVEPTYH